MQAKTDSKSVSRYFLHWLPSSNLIITLNNKMYMEDIKQKITNLNELIN
jgi:hypothetical protein